MIKLLMIFNILTFTSETVPNEPGTYPVIIEYSDQNLYASEEIQFTIITEETVIEEEIAIDAHSFTIGSEENLSENIIIIQSKAKAWNINTGERYPINRVEYVKVEDDLYEATLYSIEDIAKTINIIIDSNIHNSVSVNEEWANSFDKTNSEYYRYQFIAFVVTITLFVLLITLSIVVFNTLISRTLYKLNSTKNSVKNS